MLARTVTHALIGLEPRRVEVEAHLQRGVPAFAIVGLADRACQEAKERVRSGIASAELEWPLRRITVNLAPAALRKEGSGFDLSNIREGAFGIAGSIIARIEDAGGKATIESTLGEGTRVEMWVPSLDFSDRNTDIWTRARRRLRRRTKGG